MISKSNNKKNEREEFLRSVWHLDKQSIWSLIESGKLKRNSDLIVSILVARNENTRKEFFNEFVDDDILNKLIKDIDKEVFMINSKILDKKNFIPSITEFMKMPILSIFYTDARVFNDSNKLDGKIMNDLLDKIFDSDAKGRLLLIHHIMKVYQNKFMKEFNDNIRNLSVDDSFRTASSVFSSRERKNYAKSEIEEITDNFDVINYIVTSCKINMSRAYEQPNNIVELKQEINALKRFNKEFRSCPNRP